MYSQRRLHLQLTVLNFPSIMNLNLDDLMWTKNMSIQNITVWILIKMALCNGWQSIPRKGKVYQGYGMCEHHSKSPNAGMSINWNLTWCSTYLKSNKWTDATIFKSINFNMQLADNVTWCTLHVLNNKNIIVIPRDTSLIRSMTGDTSWILIFHWNQWKTN